jgi:hypothetical protein
VLTPALAKRAQEIETETLFGFAADVVGPWFKPESLPKTAALFAAVPLAGVHLILATPVGLFLLFKPARAAVDSAKEEKP